MSIVDLPYHNERLVRIMQRADKKIREIDYDLRQLENEKSLLKQVLHAVKIESEGQLEALLTQYSMMFSKKNTWGKQKVGEDVK